MKTNETFLKAKKDKNLSAIVVASFNDKPIIRLCIEEQSKYTNTYDHVFIETDTKIIVDNYSSYRSDTQTKTPINEICFHCSIGRGYSNHITTFLKAIKKDSEVQFRVVAYNGSDVLNNLNLVHHSLYGIVDNEQFLLSDYVGHNNTASPVK